MSTPNQKASRPSELSAVNSFCFQLLTEEAAGLAHAELRTERGRGGVNVTCECQGWSSRRCRTHVCLQRIQLNPAWWCNPPAIEIVASDVNAINAAARGYARNLPA